MSSQDYANWQRREATRAMERLDALSGGDREIEGIASSNASRFAMLSGEQAVAKQAILGRYLADLGGTSAQVEPEPLGVAGRLGVASTLVTAAGFGYEVGESIAPAHESLVIYGGAGAVVFTAAAVVAARRLLRDR